MKVLYICFLVVCAAGNSIGKSQKAPGRVLSLSAAATHILIQLGCPPAAIDEYGKIAAGKNTPPIIGKGSSVSREKIVELNIDTAVLWYYQLDIASELKLKGLRVEKVEKLRLSNYPDLIRQLGSLVEKKAESGKLCNQFKTKLKKISIPAGKLKTVYFELYAEGKCAGNESYIGDLVKASGGKSIISKTGLVSQETIISKAPEVIFYIEGFSTPEAIIHRPGIAETPAGRNDRIYPVNRRLVVEGLAPLKAIEYLKTCMR